MIYQSYLYLPEIIQTKQISWYHNDFLANHFGIKKTLELITWKYNWPTFQADL